jgi:mycofactocin system creatininase family protein
VSRLLSAGVPTRLADLSFAEAGRRAAAGAMLAVPLGSTEQHGPHLPLSTDTDIAMALCERLASVCRNVIIAPAVGYGSSGEHAGFAGTLSIGQNAMELLVIELARSASATFEHLLLVSAHGGNAEAVSRAVATLRSESRDVDLFLPRWDGDPHAGRSETSIMLNLSPHLVQMDLAERGDTRPLSVTLPLLRAGGIRAVSANGILGDPTDATEVEGQNTLELLTTELVRKVNEWLPQCAAESA